MGNDYSVIFFGTDAEDDRRIEVMLGVQELLKLGEQHVINLFDNPQGVVLYHTNDRGKADRLVRRLEHLGARAQLVDNREPRQETAADWELEEKSENTHQVFHCRACNYSRRIAETETIPAVCPQCGVVAAKYQQVAEQKRKRERIRQSILDREKAKAERTEAATQRADEDALRRQIEREVRRELGMPSPAMQRARHALIAAGMFAVGVTSSLAIEHVLTGPGQPPPTVYTPRPGPTLGAPESTRTIAKADIIAGALTGIDWQQDPPQVRRDELLVVTPEPWLDAPPTAAGKPKAPTTATSNDGIRHPAQTARTAPDAQIDDGVLSAIVGAWRPNGQVDPLTLLRMRHLAAELVHAGHAGQALSAATWVEDPEQRLALLTTITRQLALAGEQTRLDQARDQLRAVVDNAGDPSVAVPALLALDKLREQPFDESAQVDVQTRLLQLINGSQLAPEDAVVLHALVAGTISSVDAAERWFAEANHALQRIEDPVDQLAALTRLSRAYLAVGDRRTAEQLVLRVRAGSDVLDAAAPGRPRLVEQLVQTYLALGQVDAASRLIGQTAANGLDADLRRARLAVALAAQNQLTAARGMVTTIVHPAGRARANARLSAIATLRKQYTDAQLLADAAIVDIRRLPTAVQALLTSDLPQPLPDDIARVGVPEAASRSASHADERLAIVATNLAWNRAATRARRLSQRIGDTPLREQTRARIDGLAALFRAATSVSVAGTSH